MAASMTGVLSGGNMTGALSGGKLSGKLTIPERIGTPYTGEYEFTPTQSTQIVPTENKILAENIVINPIPSNYGLITWNGSFLTVS